MLKKILLNNLIALLVQILSIVLFFAAVALISNLDEFFDEFFMGFACIPIPLYVLCGFVLKPVGKLSFLSVVSVAIVLAIILVACIRPGAIDGYGEIVYLYFTPFSFPLMFLFEKNIGYLIYLLSPVYPSLLMYLGMIIRRLVDRRRQSSQL